MKRIVCAGFGGQGVLTAGLIISRTAMENGSQVTWIPSYGSEMRGGTANCEVVISDKKIASPFFRRSDVLIALNRPSMAKFQEQVVSGGLVISNSSMVRDKLLCYMIQLEGRYTWFDMFCQFCKSCANELVRLAHQRYFIFGLQEYLHPAGIN